MADDTLNDFDAIASHLGGLWRRRGTRLIAKISPDAGVRGRFTLDTTGWAFNVGYEFRDALDILREERQKDLKKYPLWTQGPMVRFKRGDHLHSHDGQRTVIVTQASAMSWDEEAGTAKPGWVSYIEPRRGSRMTPVLIAQDAGSSVDGGNTNPGSEKADAADVEGAGAIVFGHREQTVTQMQFLRLLVTGRTSPPDGADHHQLSDVRAA